MSTPKVSFKVCLHRSKETVFHRFSGHYSLAEFQTVVSHLWGGVDPTGLSFEYQDADGDKVRLSTSFEWDEALRLWAEEQSSPELQVLRPMRVFARRSNKRERKIVEKQLKTPLPSVNNRVAVAGGNVAADNSESEDEDVEEEECSPAPAVPKLALPASTEELFTEAINAEDRPLTTRREASDPAMMSVVDLLSKLFHCDAAASLYEGDSSAFSAVVHRVQDGEDVHLDIDRLALFQTVQSRGNTCLDSKNYAEAEDIYRCALCTYQSNSILEYNLACALALQGKCDEAIGQLSLAMEHGYDNMRHMMRDPDLANLQQLPAFRSLCGLPPQTPAASEPASPSQPSTVVSPRPAQASVNSRELPEPPKPVPEPPQPPVAPAPAPAPAAPAAPAAPPAPPQPPVSPAIQSLLGVFPQLTVAEAERELAKSGGNLHVTVNRLLTQV